MPSQHVVPGIHLGGHLVWGMTGCFGTWWWASCHCWPLSIPASAWALSCGSKEGKKDSEVEVISLVCELNTCLFFQDFSFISSLQILERLPEPTRGSDSPALLLGGHLRMSLTWYYICPKLFITHLLCPQRSWKRRKDRYLFRVTTCANIKFKHRCGDRALVANGLPCCGMWKMSDSGSWWMHPLPPILAAW